jgi:formylglycine-generating enzyme required for sulfatase activity
MLFLSLVVFEANATDTPEDIFWQSVRNSDLVEEYHLYVEQYPKGKYLSDAWRRISQFEVAKKPALARKDADRGPQWAEADNGSDINWNEATRYCVNKGSDWRLPTSAELQASYQSGHSTPCSPVSGQFTCKAASGSRLTGPLFWTNEQNGPSEAWYVVLNAGHRNAYPVESRNHFRALCVRQS